MIDNILFIIGCIVVIVVMIAVWDKDNIIKKSPIWKTKKEV